MPLKPVRPNLVDLNSALDELRGENPPDHLRERVLRSLRPNRTSRLRPRILIGAAVLAASAVTFWPRTGEGIAWAQSQASTATAQRTHQRWFEPDGKLGGEMWTDGKRMVDYSLDRNSKVNIEYRNDGKRMFFYSTMDGGKNAPNAEKAGAIRTLSRPMERFRNMGSNPIDQYLKTTKSDVISQKEEQTPEGSQTVYRIRRNAYGNLASTVFAETDTGRIRRIVEQSGAQTMIDYPDEIPEDTLAVDKPFTKNVKVYDSDKQQARIARIMKAGLGNNNGISLKLAALDKYGTIWFYWTGWLPDGAMSRSVRLPGIPFNGPYGSKQYTTSFKPKNEKQYLKMGGKRLAAMAVSPKVVVGDHLKVVVIPAAHGTATFRNVPLIRICTLSDLGFY